MERRTCALVILITALCLQGNILWAQKIKPVRPKPVKPILPQTTSLKINTAVSRAAAQAVTKMPDVRLSVARLDHAILLDSPMRKRPHSTAFLFETTYQGRREIWAATARHTAQQDEPLLLTFYDATQEIPVYGTIVQQGPDLLSDIALIKLVEPLPRQLRPLALAETTQTQAPLTMWGYASNRLYHVDNLTFEKDNSRFIRTDFPREQHKRAGLCGGPLLNEQGQVLGVHCGSSLEDKAYASSVQMIPYLLQAYYEGKAEVPILIKGQMLGQIHINERIFQIRCLDEHGHVLEIYEIYDQLHQSDILQLLQNPEVHAIQFLLGSYLQGVPTYRFLTYDKATQTYRVDEKSSVR